MKSTRTYVVFALLGISTAAAAAIIPNWPAPKTWTPASGGRTALAGGFPPLPFIALTPCRLVDTRGNAPLTGGFLPPATVRSYTLTGICNLPAGAQAVSLNATVVHPTGPGFLTLYPEGGTFPPVSTLNYLGGDVIVNAAVVPLSVSGGISMALGVSGGDVILDINGFYGPTPADQTQTFKLNSNSINPIMLLSNASPDCGINCGLAVLVSSGSAIYGGSSGPSASFFDSGVYGVSDYGRGVLGITESAANDTEGVYGEDYIGAGYHTGILSAGVRGEGQTGVVGLSNITGGAGVIGLAYGSTGVGVAGEAESPATTGVEAFGNLVATGAKPFVEPHPTDPT